jgi:hypothetical protein
VACWRGSHPSQAGRWLGAAAGGTKRPGLGRSASPTCAQDRARTYEPDHLAAQRRSVRNRTRHPASPSAGRGLDAEVAALDRPCLGGLAASDRLVQFVIVSRVVVPAALSELPRWPLDVGHTGAQTDSAHGSTADRLGKGMAWQAAVCGSRRRSRERPSCALKAMVRSQVSPATVRTHVGRAMVKLGARDRAQPVVVAYQTGLVGPGRAPPPG